MTKRYEMRPWTILFDLDETLMPNSYLYRLSEVAALREVQRALAPKCPASAVVLQAVERFNRELFAELGFSKDRFPTSWVHGYAHFCQVMGCPVDSQVATKVHRAAAGFQRGPFRFFRGVRSTLVRLKAAGHELHVVTLGDLELQTRKAVALGLADLVSSFNVAPRDKTSILHALSLRQPDRTVMVGDSMCFDIAPAKSIGLRAVRVETVSAWEIREVEAVPDATVKSVTELLRLLPSWG